MNMDEAGLEQSLELYRSQLSQVDQALQAAGDTDDLIKLKSDLTELITLTQESLLSLKKSQLLSSLETTSSSDQTPDAIDDEYAAFQAALGNDAFENKDAPGPSQATSEDVEPSDEEETSQQENTSVADSFSDLVGMKCRAPFSHDWGGHSHHNALVFQVETTADETSMPQVRVMFCNPTHVSMLPCKFFLNGQCRFSEEKCKFSHGCLVSISDLKEFEDPDYSHVRVGGKCFARYTDDIWHPADIVDVDEDQVTVTFTSHGNQEILDLHNILPLEPHDDESDLSDADADDDNSMLNQPVSREDSESEDELPVFLWKPPKTTQALGEWEQHTRGIASKLMAKMGYVVGQGLGANGEGRAEPVPIQLIPQGKSLDKIMELKELAGDQNLFDAMKKLKKKKRKEEKKKVDGIAVKEKPPNVFDFINKKLRGKKGNLSDLVGHSQSGGRKVETVTKHISEHELHGKSDRHLNIQALKTTEEIRKVEKELKRLQQSLSRNQDRDRGMANQVRQKIASAEAYLEKLRSSEVTLERHKQKRSDHKKLTIF